MNRSWPLIDGNTWLQGGLKIDIGGTVKENSDFVLTSSGGTFSFGAVDGNGRQAINYEPATQTPGIIKCRVVSTSNITLSTATTSVDGVTLAENDIVLVAGQSTASQNGPYTVPASGAWTRTADTIDSGTYFAVSEGTEYKDSMWRVNTNGAISLGSTALDIGLAYGAAVNLVGTGIKQSAYGFALQASGSATITCTSTDGNGRPIFVFGTSGSTLPSGTDTQTLYNNAGTWTATSTFRVNSSGYVAIGAAPNSSFKLLVSTTGGTTAIDGETSTGTGVQGFSGSGKGVYGTCASGSGVHGNTSSGNAVYATASSGFAVYADSDTGAAIFATSRQHQGGLIQQSGTLTANNNATALTVSRNQNTTTYTASQPVLQVIDVQGSTGLLIEAKSIGNTRLSLEQGGRLNVHRLNVQATAVTLSAGTTNHDVDMGTTGMAFVTVDPSGSNVTGIVAGNEGDILELTSDDQFTLIHESGSSSAANQIHWPSGVASNNFSYKLWYHNSKWRVLNHE